MVRHTANIVLVNEWKAGYHAMLNLMKKGISLESKWVKGKNTEKSSANQSRSYHSCCTCINNFHISLLCNAIHVLKEVQHINH